MRAHPAKPGRCASLTCPSTSFSAQPTHALAKNGSKCSESPMSSTKGSVQAPRGRTNSSTTALPGAWRRTWEQARRAGGGGSSPRRLPRCTEHTRISLFPHGHGLDSIDILDHLDTRVSGHMAQHHPPLCPTHVVADSYKRRVLRNSQSRASASRTGIRPTPPVETLLEQHQVSDMPAPNTS